MTPPRDKPVADGQPRKMLSPHVEDYYYLETIEQLQVLADPLRYRIAILLGEPKTGAQVARQLGLPRAQVHYHLKLLEGARLIKLHSLDQSLGITEKYYVLVGRFLSFERLMPNPEDLDGSEITAATYKAVADFLASMLSVSRERILRAPTNLRRDEGFWLDFASLGTEAQIANIRQRLIGLREEILAMKREALAGNASDKLTAFAVTLYLTPNSDLSAVPATAPGKKPNGVGRPLRSRRRGRRPEILSK
jgi:DNA-binding transcriptional ArsR family regulator